MWYDDAGVRILKETVSPAFTLMAVAKPWIVESPGPPTSQSLSGSPVRVFSQATTAKGDKAPPARVVLLSDGYSNFGRSVSTAIEAARAAHVQVSTIAFGTLNGTVTDRGRTEAVPADRDTLAAIAQQTGGSFHTATSVQELESVYADIGSQIGYITEHRDVSWRFLTVGLIVTLVAAGMSMFWSTRFV